jgi:flagellar basal body P-ring formation protein FlgA
MMRRLLIAAILFAVASAAAAQIKAGGVGPADLGEAAATGALPRGDMPIVAPQRPAPMLKRSVVVTSDLVRIGDLIDNAGIFGSIAVFRSPDVGTTGSVPARKVVEAARAHNLFGVDTGDVIDVEVTRAGHVVTKQDIEARIARLFAGTNGLGEADDLVIGFDREVTKFYADLPSGADLKAMRAIYDARAGRFDAMFEVPTGVSRRILMRYTGTLVETAPAVVPTRTVGRGEVIRAADLAIERRPKPEVGADAVLATADAIGRAARQALRQGVPLRRADLMKPETVKRDDNVTLVYEMPGIMLTTRGKALESGGDGDLINVLNLQSKHPVQGVIIGPGRVDIGASLARAMAANPGGAPGGNE